MPVAGDEPAPAGAGQLARVRPDKTIAGMPKPAGGSLDPRLQRPADLNALQPLACQPTPGPHPSCGRLDQALEVTLQLVAIRYHTVRSYGRGPAAEIRDLVA